MIIQSSLQRIGNRALTGLRAREQVARRSDEVVRMAQGERTALRVAVRSGDW